MKRPSSYPSPKSYNMAHGTRPDNQTTGFGTSFIARCLVFVLMLSSYNAKAQFIYAMLRVPDSVYNERYYGKEIRSVVETTRYVDDPAYVRRDTAFFDRKGNRIPPKTDAETFFDSITGETVIRYASQDRPREVRRRVDTANHILYASEAIHRNNQLTIQYEKEHWDPLRHTDTIFKKVYRKWDSDSDAVENSDWQIKSIYDTSDADCPIFYRYSSGKIRSKCTTTHHGDTTMWTILDYLSDTIWRTTTERQYPGRQEYRCYLKDGQLLESHDVDYGEDGLVIKCTDYKLLPKRRRELSADQRDWHSVTTYEYRYTRKHIWKECRTYIDGKLSTITKRKLRYY